MKKKKGNSLIFVIAIFAILFTVGTSALTMTATDYKSRIIESNRIENLYAADSGINVAYNIAGNVVKKAIEQANKVAQSDANIATINNAIAADRLSIKNGTRTSTNLVNADSTINEAGVRAAYLDPRFKDAFNQIISDRLLSCITQKQTIAGITQINGQNAYSYTTSPVTFDNTNASGITPDFSASTLQAPIAGGSTKYKLTVDSKYASNNGTREVTAVYYIDVPGYSGTYGTKTTSSASNPSDPSNPISGEFGKSIVAVGDLIIDSVNTATINGPIYIKGKETAGTGSIAYSKYSGGVLVNNSANVNFNGNVATSRTFRVANNSPNVNFKYGTTLYANNIYVGKDENGSSNNSSFQAQNVIIDNDLTMNATNSKITINQGLYAVSDINRTGYAKAGTKEKSSSSIIMNSTDGSSSILVNGKAYIMGTAYINTSKAYQTGESVAVKGNYNAYATMIPLDSTDYYYNSTDYSPLSLIDKKDITVFDKAAHFYNYATNAQYKGSLSITNQISLPDNGNTISTGAYISRGVVYPSNYTTNSSFQSDLLSKQREFAQQVYELGEVSLSDTTTLDSDYNTGVLSETVAKQLNLSEFKDSVRKSDSNQLILINPDPNVRIFISGQGANFKETINKDSDIVIDQSLASDMKAIIISFGDVIASGNVKYSGTIITKGNVKLEGSLSGENITLGDNADNAKVTGDLLKLFNNFIPTNNPQVTNTTVATTASVQNTVDITTVIHKGVWTIAK